MFFFATVNEQDKVNKSGMNLISQEESMQLFEMRYDKPSEPEAFL